MRVSHRWWGASAVVATLAAGLLVTGCGARSSGEGSANATVNLSSLPAAEAWVDGKAAGSTPIAVPLSPGRHELVLKQAGFSEHRQTLDVAAGAVASVDATLLPDDPMDPDAVRQVAAAYGITVEPFRAPEVHRGAAAVGGVALLYPRNDVRKEGLTGYRVDVTPAYEGGGFLEFRKGKTSLHRQKFEPDTLVNTASLPATVLDAVKTGDTVTWGIYFTDSRKPITAQFELVAKPTASKKLAELSADRRLAAQPAALRQQLEAEVLQNYRLYSEALVRLLDMRAADKDNVAPYTGIVSCLRRLDLEDTALFTEAASKALGVASRHRGANAGTGVASKRNPVGTMPAGTAPAAGPADSAPSAPLAGSTAPAPASAAPGSAAPSARNIPGAPTRPGELAPAGRKPEEAGPLADPTPVAPPIESAPAQAQPIAPERAPVESTQPIHPGSPTESGPSQPTPTQPIHPGSPTESGPSQPTPTHPIHPGSPTESQPTPTQPTETDPLHPGQPAESQPAPAPVPVPVPVPVPPEHAPTPPTQNPPAPIEPAPVPPAPILPK